MGGGGGLTEYLGQRTVMEDRINRVSYLHWCKLCVQKEKKSTKNL